LKEKSLVSVAKELSVRKRGLFSVIETSSARVQSGGIWKKVRSPSWWAPVEEIKWLMLLVSSL